MRPALIGGFAVAAVIAGFVALRPAPIASQSAAPPRAPEASPSAPALGGDNPVLVRFALPAPEADAVYLAGDFNGWAVDRIPLQRGLDGVWTATVPLPRGTFEYAYVVDGHFVADPHAERRRPDGFGGMNAVLRITDPGS